MKDLNSPFQKNNYINEELIANIQGGLIVCSLDPVTGTSKTLYMSEGWTKLTGYTEEDLENQFNGSPTAIIVSEDALRVNQEYLEQLKNGNSYQAQYRINHKDGHIVWVIDRGVVTATSDGVNQNQSIISDITLLKETEEKLRISEARFRIATKAANATVFELDLDSNTYLYIENSEVIFRAGTDEIIGWIENVKSQNDNFTLVDVLNAWYHSEDTEMLLNAVDKLQNDGVSRCEIRVRQPDGNYIWCRLHLAYLDKNKDPSRIIGHIINVDEQHKQTVKLFQEAQSDALTGLYNKNAIQELIQKSLDDLPKTTKVMLMLDIDNFKGVNDSLGHLFGDAVLMDVSSKLKKLFRRDGIVGRIGGDEFVVFLPNESNIEKVSENAENICKAFRHTYSGEKSDYKISCSVGVAFSTKDDNFESLFRKADIALYQAKAIGKDQYVIYSQESMKNLDTNDFFNHKDDMTDSGKLKIKERIFELLYGSKDFTGSINMILTLLGQLLDVSRVYIFENTADNCFSSNIYEWCADDIKSDIPNFKNFPIKELDYFSLFNKSGIFRCMDLSKLPKKIKDVLPKEIQGTDKASTLFSTFQVAIMDNEIPRGFMGYDSIGGLMSQTSDKVDIMIFAAKVIGTFIIKKRADESIKLYNQNKMEALDYLPSAIYVIDEQYQIHYINNFVLSVFPNVKLGQKCYEVFMHNSSPCLNCAAKQCNDGPCSTEIYNPYSGIWMISNASKIRWSGQDNMRLICCQVINDYK